MTGLAERHQNINNISILDWGCGPARVVWHLPELVENTNAIFACDYNKTTIEWCKSNIKGITFAQNDLLPPLPYESGKFHFLYGISIFTHLSESAHVLWIKELNRVLRLNGILLLTLHGEAFKAKLTPSEKLQFDKGELVIRDKAKEGQRMYGAFHPTAYLEKLFSNAQFQVLEHIKGKRIGNFIEQDCWILTKTADVQR